MKINDYSAIVDMAADNILLTDGSGGTKKILATDAILSMLHLNSVENHRNIFRGKNLGTTVTNEQKIAIQNGTFEGLWLGDYWYMNGVNYRIADFDYWYGKGDTSLTDHHLVIVPDSNLGTAAMHSTASTNGGYTGSAMYTSNMASAKSTINSAFGELIMSHREYLINAVTSGYPSAGAWTNSTVDLPSEPMIYGSYIYTPGNTGATDVKRYTSSKTQLALFAVAPKFIVCSGGFWLRDVVSASHFARVDSYGGATSTGGANSYGVRPVFAIG